MVLLLMRDEKPRRDERTKEKEGDNQGEGGRESVMIVVGGCCKHGPHTLFFSLFVVVTLIFRSHSS